MGKKNEPEVKASPWDNGVPTYVGDTARSWQEYVDKLAKRIDKLIKEGK